MHIPTRVPAAVRLRAPASAPATAGAARRRLLASAVAGVFAYVPVRVSLAADRLILHADLGWHFDRDGHDDHGHSRDENGTHHALTWAARADLLLPLRDERVTGIGELFGENRIRPEYQLGLRTAFVPDRLELDVSSGGHTTARVEGAGRAVGIAWPPPTFS